MAAHGDHDPQQQKWFCSYWMSRDEWLDVHDYTPVFHKEDEEENDSKDE